MHQVVLEKDIVLPLEKDIVLPWVFETPIKYLLVFYLRHPLRHPLSRLSVTVNTQSTLSHRQHS
eukprot:SAG31_NODE_26146_length_447_cov_1.517241_1_plen_63_part_10